MARTDLLDSLLGFLDMFAVVRKGARRILELSLDFRKLIIELVDQFRQSLHLSTFCQFLTVSSRLRQTGETSSLALASSESP